MGGYRKIAYIYFSGNNLYYPNTSDAFEATILQKNRFEWTKRKAIMDETSIAVKDIFIRDVYKNWYVKGINARLSDVDKLITFLAEQVKMCDEVITVGNSAGGYMATLVGCKLHADRVFCFSGQFDLSDRISNYPLLLEYLNEDEVSKYYNIVELVDNSNVPVYYFYPAYVEQDIWQANRIASCSNVRPFKFRQTIHGQSMYVEDLPKVLSYSNEKLDALFEQYSGTLILPFAWSFKVSGIKTAIKGFTISLLKKLFIKLQRIKQYSGMLKGFVRKFN